MMVALKYEGKTKRFRIVRPDGSLIREIDRTPVDRGGYVKRIDAIRKMLEMRSVEA